MRAVQSYAVEIARAVRDILQQHLPAELQAVASGAETPAEPTAYRVGDFLLYAVTGAQLPLVCVSLQSPNGATLEPHAIGRDATTGSPVYRVRLDLTVSYVAEWTGQEVQLVRVHRAAEAIANVLASRALESQDPPWKQGLVVRITSGGTVVDRGVRAPLAVYAAGAVHWQCLTFTRFVA